MRFGAPGEIVEVFDAVGLVDVGESMLTVDTEYADFEELWSGLLAGIGPAGSFVTALPDDRRHRLHDDLHRRLGAPDGPFSLSAVARCAIGHVPA